MSLLIRGGRVVTSIDDYEADIFVDGGTISALGRDLPMQATEVLDASGCIVLPGGVDPHTHLEFSTSGTVTSDSWSSGTTAAAIGGTTTVINFALQRPGESLRVALESELERADGQAAIDWGAHVIVTQIAENGLDQIDDLVGRGVTSLKLFMAYPGELMVDDATLYRCFERAGAAGALCCVHAENGGVIDVLVRRALAQGRTEPGWHARTRPEAAEAEATHRAIALAEMAGAPVYFVHLSCAEALDEVTRARDRGRPVFAETCPHYLFLDERLYDEAPSFDAAKYVLTPPLRNLRHQQHLWRGLRTDDLQVVSTDHCPFCLKGQKELGRDDFSKIPNGGPGIEHRLSLLYSGGVLAGHLSLRRMVDVFSTAPARLFGLYPRKGALAVGSDADIVLFDPVSERTISASTHHMNVDYSLYEGRPVTGAVRTVVLRGSVIVEDGEFVGQLGAGRFLHRGPSGQS